ncbi:MAG: prepilin-type N-terminal cleavage/methylation domain-containing protein [Proteobacteria bacterium]|nr:prepilin-type N-terminal cleavage/methylation domain-containing protein [Pseudomonadota bacterium]
MTSEDKYSAKVAPPCFDPGTADRETGSHGFTIIEVMISIMILSVSVVSIFGAQFATVATVGFSRYTTQAIELARCRMSEIELEVQIENGFELGDVTSRGECCEMLENDTAEFSCSWEIKTLEIPDIMSLMAAQDGGVGMSGGLGGGMGILGGSGAGDSLDDMGMLGAVSSFLPMLSDLLGQAIRRVTVTVEWTQGIRKRDFVLSQYLVHPTQGPLQLMNSAADAMDRQEILEDSQGSPSPAGGFPF